MQLNSWRAPKEASCYAIFSSPIVLPYRLLRIFHLLLILRISVTTSQEPVSLVLLPMFFGMWPPITSPHVVTLWSSMLLDYWTSTMFSPLIASPLSLLTISPQTNGKTPWMPFHFLWHLSSLSLKRKTMFITRFYFDKKIIVYSQISGFSSLLVKLLYCCTY